MSDLENTSPLESGVPDAASAEAASAKHAPVVSSAAEGASEAVRLAKLEGRVKALEERIEDLLAIERSRKQRAVYYRLVLLLLLLGAFFFLRMKQGAAS
jgi:hypothetical protein